MKKQMLSNVEVFFNFLAMNYSITEYIIAYRKRYDTRYKPLYPTIRIVANNKPKGLFEDVLGTVHKFKDLEKKWIKYVDDSICYKPKCGDFVYCSFLDDKTYDVVSCVCQFWEGNKEEFIDINGDTHNCHTFFRKATQTEVENLSNYK